jgi:branched-chain amino acid aminotransferase
MSSAWPGTITRAPRSRLPDVDFDQLPFGQIFSDHMLTAEHRDGRWQAPEIVPYQPLSASPAMAALHYGQSIFEGLKVYRRADGTPLFFRLRDNHARILRSAERMVMPAVPEEIFVGGIEELIRLDAGWIPDRDGSALYVRPILFAADEFIGVRPSQSYRFIVFTCPVGRYFSRPVKLWATREFVRASEGGTGEAKAAGNYASCYAAIRQAQQHGYDDVLWLDGRERRYIEECATMNMFFVIDGVAVTPSLSGTILRGITRDSVLTLLADMEVATEERRISLDEIAGAHQRGRLGEVFGVGTAATIAPVAAIGSADAVWNLPPEGPIGTALLEQLTSIRLGRVADRHGWVEPLSGARS